MHSPPLPHAGINGVHHDAGFKLSFVERVHPAQPYTKPLWSWLFTKRLPLPCYFLEFKSSLLLRFYLSTPFLSEYLDQALPLPAASIVSRGLFCLFALIFFCFFFRLFCFCCAEVQPRTLPVWQAPMWSLCCTPIFLSIWGVQLQKPPLKCLSSKGTHTVLLS